MTFVNIPLQGGDICSMFVFSGAKSVKKMFQDFGHMTRLGDGMGPIQHTTVKNHLNDLTKKLLGEEGG